ncbi:MAG TPA: hypothetical protein VG079_02090 [Gaiellaceae bacterium]|nr:hypothetical protein [Gaiellaceae bacterium]
MTEQTDEPGALKPVHVRSDEGEARWWFGGLAVLEATSADTGADAGGESRD